MRSFTRPGVIRVLAAAMVLLAGAAVSLDAQATGTLRGRVTEAGSQRALNGAQVTVVGTSRRAVTDESGQYTLANVPAGSVRVRAELIGHTPAEQTVTVPAGGTARADLALSAAALQLDALVVTGTAGATQQRAVGNAVTTVAAADVVAKAPVNTVTQLLQARAPGLTIMQPSGTSGTASSFRIRGTGSYAAGNQPIFYIDGIRMNSGGQSGFGVGGQSTSALDAINPDDIESIEVIKGPAAATLYGAEAAAGVIQIITKKGKVGDQSIQWNAKVEAGQLDWAVDMPTNYLLCTSSRTKSSNFPGCSGLEANTMISGQPLNDVLQTGGVRSYTLGARGGGDRYSFYVSGDREEENGVFENNFFNRTSGRANFFVTPLDKLDLAANIQFTRSDTRLPLNDNASNGWLRNAFRGYPGFFREGSSFAEGWRGLGPAEMRIYDNQTAAERFIMATTVNYQPLSWFRNRLTAGLDANNRRNTVFYPIDESGRTPYGATNGLGAVYLFQPETRNWTLDYAGTLSHELPREISSDFSFGMQLNAYTFRSMETWGQGLVSNRVRVVHKAAESGVDEERFSEQNSLGYFVQEQLGWQNRLFLTGAVRVDDNSAFGAEFDRVLYPKVSGSYVISEEPFFSVPGVSELKLRAAWGQAGNAPAPFSADRSYDAASLVLADKSQVTAIRAESFGNPNLKAETGSEFEAGLDASLLGGRAAVDFTYYDKTTKDALIYVPVAPSTGFAGSVLANVGEISNRGFEVALSGTPLETRSFGWDTRLTFSTNDNEFVSFGGTRDEPILQGYGGGSQRVAEGYPMGGYWAKPPVLNEDGTYKIVKGRAVLADEEVYIGPSIPTREVGFANTFTLLNNLRLYAFADYKGGHYLFNMTEQTRNRDGNTFVVNDPSADPTLVDYLTTPGNNYPYIQQADFVKLREVSLTYTLPGTLANRFGGKGLSLSLAGRNLGVWTKYDGVDPEVNIQGDATFTRGDYMSVPMIRRVVATVNVSF